MASSWNIAKHENKRLQKQNIRPDGVGIRWLPTVISSPPARIHSHGRSLGRSHCSLSNAARFLTILVVGTTFPPTPPSVPYRTHCPLSSLSIPAFPLRWGTYPAAASYNHQALICDRLQSVRGTTCVNFFFLFIPLGDVSLNRSARCGEHLVSNGAINIRNPTKKSIKERAKTSVHAMKYTKNAYEWSRIVSHTSTHRYT